MYSREGFWDNARVRVGYIRTSKKEQNPQLQRRDLLAAGCQNRRWLREGAAVLTARLQRVSWPRWKALSGVAGPALGVFLAQSRSSRPRDFAHWFEFCPPGDF